jgi:hypothetical protein
VPLGAVVHDLALPPQKLRIEAALYAGDLDRREVEVSVG